MNADDIREYTVFLLGELERRRTILRGDGYPDEQKEAKQLDARINVYRDWLNMFDAIVDTMPR